MRRWREDDEVPRECPTCGEEQLSSRFNLQTGTPEAEYACGSYIKHDRCTDCNGVASFNEECVIDGW